MSLLLRSLRPYFLFQSESQGFTCMRESCPSRLCKTTSILWSLRYLFDKANKTATTDIKRYNSALQNTKQMLGALLKRPQPPHLEMVYLQLASLCIIKFSTVPTSSSAIDTKHQALIENCDISGLTFGDQINYGCYSSKKIEKVTKPIVNLSTALWKPLVWRGSWTAGRAHSGPWDRGAVREVVKENWLGLVADCDSELIRESQTVPQVWINRAARAGTSDVFWTWHGCW